MPHRLPPLTALRAFEVAARTQSYTAAATELGVTHGAVSRQISLLESWLGQTLFTRVGRGMTATPHGRAFAREISRAFDQIADAAQRYGTLASDDVIQVNAPATFAMRWLIPHLRTFRAVHPKIEVRVSTSTTLTEGAQRSFDVAIRRGPQAWEQFDAVKIVDEENTLLASPALLKRQPLHRLASLARHTILTTETRPRDWENWLAAAGYHGPAPARQHRHDHFFVTLQAAIDGLGLIVGPLPVLEQDVTLSRLVLPFPKIRVPCRSYFALTPCDVDKTAALGHFLDWIVREGHLPKAQ